MLSIKIKMLLLLMISLINMNIALDINNNNIDNIPNTGFISAKADKDTMVFKVKSKIHSPGFCHTIEFINIPKENPSPLVGSTEFVINMKQLYNEHYSWFNGREYLSYVRTEEMEHGHWIVGNSPGVDSGYIFLATKYPSMVPVNLESSVVTWQWLMHGKWNPQPQLKMICKHPFSKSTIIDHEKKVNNVEDNNYMSDEMINKLIASHYNIEYFDHSHQNHHSVLLPYVNLAIISSLNKQLQPKNSDNSITFAAFHDKSTGLWIPLTDLHNIVTKGI